MEEERSQSNVRLVEHLTSSDPFRKKQRVEWFGEGVGLDDQVVSLLSMETVRREQDKITEFDEELQKQDTTAKLGYNEQDISISTYVASTHMLGLLGNAPLKSENLTLQPLKAVDVGEVPAGWSEFGGNEKYPRGKQLSNGSGVALLACKYSYDNNNNSIENKENSNSTSNTLSKDDMEWAKGCGRNLAYNPSKYAELTSIPEGDVLDLLPVKLRGKNTMYQPLEEPKPNNTRINASVYAELLDVTPTLLDLEPLQTSYFTVVDAVLPIVMAEPVPVRALRKVEIKQILNALVTINSQVLQLVDSYATMHVIPLFFTSFAKSQLDFQEERNLNYVLQSSVEDVALLLTEDVDEDIYGTVEELHNQCADYFKDLKYTDTFTEQMKPYLCSYDLDVIYSAMYIWCRYIDTHLVVTHDRQQEHPHPQQWNLLEQKLIASQSVFQSHIQTQTQSLGVQFTNNELLTAHCSNTCTKNHQMSETPY